MDFRWPRSAADIQRIHSERKRVAVERALQSPFWKRRMPPIDLARLDAELLVEALGRDLAQLLLGKQRNPSPHVGIIEALEIELGHAFPEER